jgi:general secretion pathway protein L
MSRQILAIDIRSDSIAAVLLNLGLKLNTVVTSTTVPLPPTSEDGDPLVQALLHLKGEIDIGTANVAVSLPSDGISYHKLQIPFKEDSKIRQVLPFELEPLLPINIDNLKFDFHKNHSADQTHILAAAIDQSLLQRYLDALSEANIRPQLVVPGGFPLVRYLSSSSERSSEQMLVLDVESDKTTLYFVNSGKIELVRRLSSTIHNEQAAEALALRIRQTLTAMSEHQDDFIMPAKVYLTGPGLKDADLFQRITLSLELPGEKVHLAQWAPRLEMEDLTNWIPHTMSNALALALLEADGKPCVNFHRTTSPLRNFWTAYRSYIMGPAILLAVSLLIGLCGVIIDKHHLNKTVKNLDAQIKQVYLSTFPSSTIKNNIDPLDLMKSKIKGLKSGDTSSGQNPSSVRTIDVLLQVSQLIPKDIEVLLTQMTVGEDTVSISGETGDFNSVDDIKSRVEKGDLFKRVTIASANMDKSGKKVRFKLKIDL